VGGGGGGGASIATFIPEAFIEQGGRQIIHLRHAQSTPVILLLRVEFEGKAVLGPAGCAKSP